MERRRCTSTGTGDDSSPSQPSSTRCCPRSSRTGVAVTTTCLGLRFLIHLSGPQDETSAPGKSAAARGGGSTEWLTSHECYACLGIRACSAGSLLSYHPQIVDRLIEGVSFLPGGPI